MANGQYDYSDLTVEKTFKEFYIVPDYQREYVWEAEKHVIQLLNDMYDAYSANKDKEYFIGTTVVFNNNGQLELIDGQQRTTTLFLMLCAFRNIYKKYNLSTSVMDKAIFDSNLDDNGEEVQKYRLELQYADSTNILESIANNLTNIQTTSNSSVRLVEAYNCIEQFVNDNINNDDNELKALFMYFFRKLKYIQILTPDINDALKIFETINDRGAGLNPMDLLKNLVFRHAGRQNFDRLKERWKYLVNILEQANEKPLRFLRYFIMSNYPHPDNNGDSKKPENIVREDQIYDWLNHHAQECGYDSHPFDFVELLIDNARCYVNFSSAKDAHGNTNIYLDNIVKLAGAAFKQHQILLLTARKFPVEMFDLLCKSIETYLFYFLFTKEQAKIYEKQFAKWDLILANVSDIDQLKDFIAAEMQPRIAEKELEYKARFLSFSENDLQKYRIKYILAKFTQYVDLARMGNPTLSVLDNYMRSSVQIEHILPQNPDSQLRALYEDYDSLMHMFGNLTLIEDSMNSVVGNKPFADKVQAYPMCPYYLTSSIAKLDEVGVNSAINRISSKLQTFDHWDEQTIAQRQEMLYKLSLDIWNLNA